MIMEVSAALVVSVHPRSLRGWLIQLLFKKRLLSTASGNANCTSRKPCKTLNISPPSETVLLKYTFSSLGLNEFQSVQS